MIALPDDISRAALHGKLASAYAYRSLADMAEAGGDARRAASSRQLEHNRMAEARAIAAARRTSTHPKGA